LHFVIRHGYGRTAKGVGLYNVCAGIEILPVYADNDVGLGKIEQVIISLYIAMPILESLSTVIRFGKFMSLYHGTHGTVNYQNALLQGFLNAVHVG
jgi:hypothetical protein